MLEGKKCAGILVKDMHRKDNLTSPVWVAQGKIYVLWLSGASMLKYVFTRCGSEP